jgi:hypothetical protein
MTITELIKLYEQERVKGAITPEGKAGAWLKALVSPVILEDPYRSGFNGNINKMWEAFSLENVRSKTCLNMGFLDFNNRVERILLEILFPFVENKVWLGPVIIPVNELLGHK